MDYGTLPPEINSARMYSGAGPEPMLAAAAAWDRLAAELRSTAAAHSSVISELTTAWRGPSSASMAAAAAPYTTWLTTTAAHAEQSANQARVAVTAYETAFAATVPPPVIAANRAALASLISTNIFGHNTAAIAATEAHYARMWAQDSAAMYRYAGHSAAASTLTPFDSPQHNTNPASTAAHTAAVTQAAGAHTQAALSQLTSATPGALQSLAAPAAAANPLSPLSGLTNLLDSLNSSPLATLAGDLELPAQAILPANSALINTVLALTLGNQGLDAATAAAGEGGSALAAGLGSDASAGSAGLAGAGPAVSASVGQAGSVRGLAVPPSWAAATPAIRTVSAVLSGTAQGGVPAAAVSQGSLLSATTLAGAAGVALGAAVPRAVAGTGARGRGGSVKGREALKDADSPQNLQRLVAEMADKPENVQHWHTDAEHLDGLLAELRQKPGTHAVHVSKGAKPKMTPPTSRPT
jgi:PPE-repeat protein